MLIDNFLVLSIGGAGELQFPAPRLIVRILTLRAAIRAPLGEGLLILP